MRNLGANINPKSVELAGKWISVVHHVCAAFGKDFETVLKVLEEENVFVPLCTLHSRTLIMD